MVAERWKRFDFHDAGVLRMARALAPAYWRFGGTAADLLIFDDVDPHHHPNQEATCYAVTDAKGNYVCENLRRLYDRANFTMTKEDWVQMNTFAQRVGWRLIFDFNVLLRNGENWDESNARKLLDFSVQQNYKQLVSEGDEVL